MKKTAEMPTAEGRVRAFGAVLVRTLRVAVVPQLVYEAG
jgi:hypothetical protein